MNIFDANGSPVSDNWIIDLGMIDADTVVNASLYVKDCLGLSVKLLDMNLQLFSVDSDSNLQLNQSKQYTVTTNDLQEIPIVLDATNKLGIVTGFLISVVFCNSYFLRHKM